MKRVIEILAYVSAIVLAISEGAKVANTHWPVTNPFTKNESQSKQPESKPTE